MKNQKPLVTLTLSVLTLTLLALPSASFAATRAECAAVKPTADKTKLIQAAFLDSEKESIPLQADLKLATLEENKLVTSVDATFDAAQAASAKTADARAKLAALKMKLRNTILYSISAPENRTLADQCFSRGEADSRRMSRERERSRNSRGRNRGRRNGPGSSTPVGTTPDPTAPIATTPTDGTDPTAVIPDAGQ